MCFHPLPELTYNFSGLMQGGRSSIANALALCLVCINSLFGYLLSSQHEVVLSINIAAHGLPLRVTSMPAVRSDLNGGLLTSLFHYVSEI